MHGKSGSGIGVQGTAGSGTGVLDESSGLYGVYGNSVSNTGVFGNSGSGVGVWGNSNGSATGVFGVSSGGPAVWGDSGTSFGGLFRSFSPNVPGLFCSNSAAAGPTKLAALIDGNITITGNQTVLGTKSAVVPHPDGQLRTLYCQESPEAWFEDFGRGQVAGGVGRVNLDREFGVLVNLEGYHVLLTAEGAGSLYIAQQDQRGFEVRELGGKSIGFSYRVVAKRKDVVGERLRKVDPQSTKVKVLSGPAPGMSSPLEPNPQQPNGGVPRPPVSVGGNGAR